MATSVHAPTIVVLGGINMDLIATAPRLPMPGETVRGSEFYTTPGGKGANHAVAAARLGAGVRMIGRVGKDTFGPSMLDDLRAHGIDVTGVSEDPVNASGVAVILLDDSRQNHIVAVYGANAACDDTELRAATSALDGADVLMLQLEIPFEVSLAAAREAKSRGVTVVLDPAPAAPLPPGSLETVDVLTPNQTEATFLTKVEVRDLASAQEAAHALVKMGVAVAAVKLGPEGVCYASRAESGEVSAFRVEAVDTIAAGDAFGGALAVALAEGAGLKEAVRFGAAAGALAVTKPGAQEAMPSRREVEALVLRG